jgi:hypothetical protein
VHQVPFDVLTMAFSEFPVYLRSIRLLRLMRLAKAIKLVKNMRFLQELQTYFGISFTALAVIK